MQRPPLLFFLVLAGCPRGSSNATNNTPSRPASTQIPQTTLVTPTVTYNNGTLAIQVNAGALLMCSGHQIHLTITKIYGEIAVCFCQQPISGRFCCECPTWTVTHTNWPGHAGWRKVTISNPAGTAYSCKTVTYNGAPASYTQDPSNPNIFYITTITYPLRPLLCVHIYSAIEGPVCAQNNCVIPANCSIYTNCCFDFCFNYPFAQPSGDRGAGLENTTEGMTLTTTVLPNPFVDQVSLSISAPGTESATVEVYSQAGAQLMVKSYELDTTTGAGKFNIDLATLPNGVYFLKVTNTLGTQQHMVIKQ